LDIISAVTAVYLITADLPADSEIRTRYEFTEVSSRGAGSNILLMAGRFLRNQLHLTRAMIDRDEDIVLVFGATSYLLPILVARLLGRDVLIEPRGDVPLTLRLHWEQRWPTPIARFAAALVRGLERIGFGLASGIVTYTPSMARELGVDPESETVFPSGARYVRTERFSPTARYESRAELVGYIGRFEPEKGIPELAAAAKRLASVGIRFVFVGQGQLEGWLRKQLSEEIEAGLVQIRGWVPHDEMPGELNRLRLLVMASAPTEGLPTTILEAMACGTPVCAPPVSGIPDVVIPGKTGLLMRTREPEEIESKIRSVLDDEQAAIELSRSCRELVEESFTLEAASSRYADIFNTVSG
jgi:glycosyltransferase involved in cell wall biosynthesis